MKATHVDNLRSLPNIGRTLAERLLAVGIRDATDLKRLGSIEAALLICGAGPADPPCQSMLYALEGAIRGVRWHAIAREERASLWNEYQARARAAAVPQTAQP